MQSLFAFPAFRTRCQTAPGGDGAIGHQLLWHSDVAENSLRAALGIWPEYLGLFNAAGALGYMGMSLPSGALGSALG
ncbi:MAG: hypothetical protein R2911_16735 [Caldilineaceae bacterium]